MVLSFQTNIGILNKNSECTSIYNVNYKHVPEVLIKQIHYNELTSNLDYNFIVQYKGHEFNF